MIPVYEEPADLAADSGIYEKCVFCGQSTKYWHEGTNNPVCAACANLHSVSELKIH